MSLKLLHTVPSIDVADGGGLGGATLALHQQLLADGEQSRLVTTGSRGRIDAKNITSLRILRRNPFFYDPRSRAVIDDAVRNADVVHAHGLYSHLNWCVGDSCARWNKPLVYHPQGTLAPWYLRKRWLAKRVVHRLFEDRNFALAQLWRAVSDAEKRDIARVSPGAQVVVIPNGIDAAAFPSQCERSGKTLFPQLDSARRWLLFFGRIAAVKGLDLLLAAWAKLAMFHAEWQLVIVGPDFESYRSQLNAGVANFAGKSSPVICDRMVGGAKLRLLSAADLFVLPSRGEGLPVTVLEALASQLPVVLTTACNFPAATLGEAGWVTEPDIESLTRALHRALLSSRAELQWRGNLGRQLVESQFDWRRISASIAECSRRVLGCRAE